MRYGWLVAFVLLLASCENSSQKDTPSHVLVSDIVAENRWWKAFNDPLMDQLADQLLSQNIDIAIARARVTEARGLVRVAESGLFPAISATGNAQRGDDQVGQIKAGSIIKGGFDAAWEIDIFGRMRSQVSAAENQEIAASASLQDVQNSMLAELLKALVSWHQAQQTLKETNALLAAQEDQVKLLASRAKAGLIDASFKERADAEYAQTATQLPLAQASLDTAEYTIEKLLGKASGDLHSWLNTQITNELNVPPAEKALEMSLDTIRTRPDIRAAKAQMLAAQANLDEAEANLWPRLTLSGFFGAEGTTNLLAAENPIWSIGSGITAPLLNFGQLRGAVDSANAKAQEASLTYENAALGALQEAKMALSDYLNGINAVNRQSEALQHRQEAIRLAKKRFVRGLTDMTDLTTAQAELDQATLSLIAQKATTAIAFIRLQKAMGVAFR